MVIRYYIFLVLIFSSPFLHSSDSELVSWINDYRIINGAEPLIVEQALNITAEKYGEILFDEGRISHLDSQGNRVLQRYINQEGTACEAGEILGTGRSKNDIFRSWLNSESHEKLLSDSKWLRIGTALVEREGVFVAVVLFSTSLIQKYSFELDDDILTLSIETIKVENDIIFSPNILSSFNTNYRVGLNNYLFKLSKEELPMLITVSVESEGRIAISDLIYLREIKYNKSY